MTSSADPPIALPAIDSVVLRGDRRARTAWLLRRHAPALVVLALVTLLRVAVQIAYAPLLFYDSLTYLHAANGSLFSNPDAPGGYPFAIRVLRFGGTGLGVLIGVQHLAGVITAALVYVIVVRLTGRRWWAAFACAVVGLDAYAIAVEQYAMSDAIFTLLLTASAVLVVLGRRPGVVTAGCLLLALACLVRTAGLFCIPVWLIYLLWRHGRTATTLLCVMATCLPLVAYAAANHGQTGHFTLTEDTAWLLYGRVAPIGDCKGLSIPHDERILCPHGVQVGQDVNWYLNSSASPAVKAFGKPAVNAPARVNRTLLAYALHVMEARPGQYAGQVGGAFLDFFTPGAASEGAHTNGALILPKPGPWLWPFYRPRQTWPASLVRAYASIAHTIRPLLALFAITGLLGLLLGGRGSHSPEPSPRAATALLALGGLLLLLGSAANHFELRYVLPAVPLLTSGGIVGLSLVLRRTVGRDRNAQPVAV